MIHCNLDECRSGYMIYVVLETTIERCNIIDNEPGINGKSLIHDGGITVLRNCVSSQYPLLTVQARKYLHPHASSVGIVLSMTELRNVFQRTH